MTNNDIDLDPVDQITTDAIGKPGQRVFYLQGRKDQEIVTLIIEKFQLQSIIASSEKFLGEIYSKYPHLSVSTADYHEADMVINPPVEPRFRVGFFGLAYDHLRDLICITASKTIPIPDSDDNSPLTRFWCTRNQFVNLIHWGTIVVERGREICPQCLQPMDPNGHFCPKKNGHKKSRKV